MSLSDELKALATNVCKEKVVFRGAAIAEVLRREAKFAAGAGNFSLHIWLKNKNWLREDAEVAAIELRKENLEVVIVNEIVAWYSNTDWDTEEFIKVSWK